MLILDSMRLAVETDLVELVVDGLGPYFLNVLLLLCQLVVDLLDLVLQDLELSLFVLKLLRVDVDLTLEASSLRLVDGVTTATHAAPCNRCHFKSRFEF